MKNKTKISISIFAVAISSVVISEYSSSADGSNGGAIAGVCGDPAGGGKTCNQATCHTGAPVTVDTGWITTNIPIAGYTAGSTYTITAKATRANHTRFGFEISPQNAAGTLEGTLINTVAASTQILTGNKYITHKATGTTGTTGFHTWTFNWTAPATGNGPVTFYGAFNITNNDGNNTGDSIVTSTIVVTEKTTTGIKELKDISNLISVYPNPTTNNFFVSNSLNETENMTVNISDMNGKLVQKIQNVNGSKSSINIDDLAKGFYFLRIETSRGDVLKKIIKE
jgi:hypothetical protein